MFLLFKCVFFLYLNAFSAKANLSLDLRAFKYIGTNLDLDDSKYAILHFIKH